MGSSDIISELNVGNIQMFAEQCLKITADHALIETSQHGGYFIIPDSVNSTDSIPIYSSVFPSDTLLENQIREYINRNVDLCFEDFELLTKQGYEIYFTSKDITVIFDESSEESSSAQKYITVQANVDLTVKKNLQINQFKSFEITLDAEDYFETIQTARQIINTKTNDGLCITCYGDLAEKYNISVNILERDTVIILDVHNHNYSLYGEEFHVIFSMNK